MEVNGQVGLRADAEVSVVVLMLRRDIRSGETCSVTSMLQPAKVHLSRKSNFARSAAAPAAVEEDEMRNVRRGCLLIHGD